MLPVPDSKSNAAQNISFLPIIQAISSLFWTVSKWESFVACFEVLGLTRLRRGRKRSSSKIVDRELVYNDELTASKWALNSAVECHLHTVEVIGSNPIAPTILSRVSNHQRTTLFIVKILRTRGPFCNPITKTLSAPCLSLTWCSRFGYD